MSKVIAYSIKRYDIYSDETSRAWQPVREPARLEARSLKARAWKSMKRGLEPGERFTPPDFEP